MIKNYARQFPVTASIMGICIAFFFIIKSGVLPVTAFLSIGGVWTIGSFLSDFAHLEYFHIILNIFVLYQIGPLLERKVGSRDFALVTLGIWILTVLISVPFLEVGSASLGYSGILMGQLAMLFMLFYNMPSIRNQLGFWLVLNVIIGLDPGISFVGHASGAIAGFITYGLYTVSNQ